MVHCSKQWRQGRVIETLNERTKPPSSSIRIAHVAELAGVSTATVSRALASPGQVRPATLALVMEAVKNSGYRPNSSARNLRTQRTKMVLVVMPSIANPVFAEVLRGIDTELTTAGYGVVIGNLDNNPGKEPRFVELAFSREVDGVILLNGWIPRSGRHSLLESGLPVVSMCSAIGDEVVPDVTVDDAAAGREAARYLVGLGHAALGYAAGPIGHPVDSARWTGFRDAAIDMGVEPGRIRRFEGQKEARFSYQSGVSSAESFLALSDDRPTAVFCASDEMAIAFMKTVRDRGVDIPRDLSVVGFDGITAGRFVHPTLTTFLQPKHDLGCAGARVLLELFAGAERSQALSKKIAVSLVERESTAPPPA
jgi:LacI family repressor for deo operon, udp, cdd, tsx, nupC, and nupG